jgi:hypothetical protein
MKQQNYMKAVLKKIGINEMVTCEDCGKRDRLGHFIINHDENTVKGVCHSCFVTKYQAGLYGREYTA